MAVLACEPTVRERLWEESLDIAGGGKRYFAWLRDRYYLDDGFGPMLLRANFALTVGFSEVHEVLLQRLKSPSDPSA